MADQHTQTRCGELQALLASATEDGDYDQILREISEHIADCPECALSEARLNSLLSAYAGSEPAPISADFETRLLDRMCGPNSTFGTH